MYGYLHHQALDEKYSSVWQENERQADLQTTQNEEKNRTTDSTIKTAPSQESEQLSARLSSFECISRSTLAKGFMPVHAAGFIQHASMADALVFQRSLSELSAFSA